MLESIVRIAQAHARLMCHHEIYLSDAIATITVMESSMQVQRLPPVLFHLIHPRFIEGAALLGIVSPLHSSFPPDPRAEV
jgi:DNA helicase MCM9